MAGKIECTIILQPQSASTNDVDLMRIQTASHAIVTPHDYDLYLDPPYQSTASENIDLGTDQVERMQQHPHCIIGTADGGALLMLA